MSNFENARIQAVQNTEDELTEKTEANALQSNIAEAELLGQIPFFQVEQIHPKFWIAFAPLENWEQCVHYATQTKGISSIEIHFEKILLIRVNQQFTKHQIHDTIANTYLPF